VAKGLVPVLILVTLFAVACGAQATATPTRPALPPVNADIKNSTHETLNVKVGTTVVWTNRDEVPHTSTEKNGSWDSSFLILGRSFSFTFTEPGTYDYFCALHPQMTATVTVER